MVQLGSIKSILLMLGLLFSSNQLFALNDQLKSNKPTFSSGEHFAIVPDLIRSAPEVEQLIKKDNNSIRYKPQIIMFFNYGCYGCWMLNKDFRVWAQNNSKQVSLYIFPVAFGRMWENLAQLYYVNEELFPKDDGEPIFTALHKEHKHLWIESEIVNFYEQHNIAKDIVLQKYHSFTVDRKVKKAIAIAKAYKIYATPNIIINGKHHSYMVNFAMVPDPKTLFTVIDYLIKENPNT